MMTNKKLTKKELVEILVNVYGYEKEDLKDTEGKPYTNAKLESIIKQEEEDAELLEHKETASPVVHTFEIKDDDMISVMSGARSELIHRSNRTGRMWKFTKFGQTDKMPFIEILTIYNNNPKCFEDGRLIILNKQIVDNFRLNDIYKNIITPQNLDELFNKEPEELKETIKNLPQSMKGTFFFRARELYEQQALDSVKIIKAIEESFKISLEDNAPLSDLAGSYGDE